MVLNPRVTTDFSYQSAFSFPYPDIKALDDLIFYAHRLSLSFLYPSQNTEPLFARFPQNDIMSPHDV